MRVRLRGTLKKECDKLCTRHLTYLRELDQDVKRIAKRRAVPSGQIRKEIQTPFYWRLDTRFNPFKTRCRKKLDVYSYTLAKKIQCGEYSPQTAVTHQIPKHGGGTRTLNVFQIPDAAVSTMFYRDLLAKNQARMAAYSYAYRTDRGAHDAIADIATSWSRKDRIYVAEFDFSKYFDSIDHDYILSSLNDGGFVCSDHEAHVINSFLTSSSLPAGDYNDSTTIAERRTVGIPQGTSLSLFLANVACWELDRKLEEHGVRYARYADDVLIWSDSYAKVSESYNVIRDHGRRMSVDINMDKSDGISLISEIGSEIRGKNNVDFLGYRLGPGKVSVGSKSVAKIKAKVGLLIHQNLTQLPKAGVLNTNRLDPSIDWDYVVAIYQIRRYMYGGLSEDRIRAYLAGRVPKLTFRGVMSYFPLIDDETQLRKLDGWLLYSLRSALRLRSRLWQKTLPGPRPDWAEQPQRLRLYKHHDGSSFDLRAPSFRLINRALKEAIVRQGIRSLASNRLMTNYNYHLR